MSRTSAIVVAAGAGKRFGRDEAVRLPAGASPSSSGRSRAFQAHGGGRRRRPRPARRAGPEALPDALRQDRRHRPRRREAPGLGLAGVPPSRRRGGGGRPRPRRGPAARRRRASSAGSSPRPGPTGRPSPSCRSKRRSRRSRTVASSGRSSIKSLPADYFQGAASTCMIERAASSTWTKERHWFPPKMVISPSMSALAVSRLTTRSKR